MKKSTVRGKYFIVLMSSFMFLILLVANMLRVLKEGLIMSHVGVKSLSYIRILLQVPLSFGIVYVLAKLKKKYHQQHIFNLVLLHYIIFMFVFANILYPYRDALSLPISLQSTVLQTAPFIEKIVPVIHHWPITLLYLFSDLWGLLLYLNCFWELSNRIVDTQEAAKIYPLYNILGQSNILFAALALYYLSSNDIKQYAEVLGLDFVQCVGNTVLCIMILIFILHNYINSKYEHKNERVSVTKQHKKLSFRQTLKLLWDNRHIFNIFSFTLLYYATIFIIETLWLYFLSESHSSTQMIAQFQAQTLLMIGLSTMLFALIGKFLLRRFGWYFMLKTLPCTLLMLFLVLMISHTNAILSYYPLVMLHLSTGIYALSKSMKYTFFDTTKEMAYIPTDDALKFYGKVSADTLASSAGKFIGNIFPLIFFTSYRERNFDSTVTLCLTFILVLLGCYWLFVAKRLNLSYHQTLAKSAE